ncbi:MAG: SRPBCC domain-containing protein [Reyranellaceae bacterium]
MDGVTAIDTRQLRIARRFKAPREMVFKAWTDRTMFAKWFGPDHFRTTHCALDVREGGAWSATLKGPERLHSVSGTFLKVKAPSSLEFTWAWHETGDSKTPRQHETIISVELVDRGEETDMVFIQGLFRDADGARSHNEGWDSGFDCLDRLLVGCEPKTD